MNGEVSLLEFTEEFPDEQSCIDFLTESLFPKGVTSPFVEGGDCYPIKTRPGVYKCKGTRKTFTIRKGTIFEESRLGLRKWFFCIFLMHSLKKGISSVQIAKTVGVTQKTAWFMLHRVRYAVEHESFKAPLGGTVEIDEHYSGGSTKGGKRGRGAESKTPIVGMVERESGEIRCQAVSDCKMATLTPIVRENVAVTARVMTDEWSGYNALPNHGYSRETVNHGRKEYVRGDVHTNTIEGFWSHLKAGIKAIQIHVSPKHLNKYCKEYQFRYNHRKITDYERFEAFFGWCGGRLTYRDLIA